jgi:rhamnulokinase
MDAGRFLAFDLGAESGRAVVGTLQEGRLSLEEIHRFPNEPVQVCDTLHWDVLALFGNVLKGMREYAVRFGDSVNGVGIDTWGVDFGFLGRDGKLLQNPVHYRDRRTEGILEEIGCRISSEELFQRTGMPLARHHTVCQLLSLRLNQNPLLESATTFLMMPDILNYFLTGQKSCERTNAITTQLFDPSKGRWSEEVLRSLDLPRSIMPELINPGAVLVDLDSSVKTAAGLNRAVVVAPCTHDTASAVAAVPGEGEDWAFISSGTWSVVGALTEELVTSPEAFSAGVCNELTLQSFFLCRNIMGLWLLQQSRALWQQGGEAYTYADLVQMAEQAPEGGPLVHPDDPSFLAPKDMARAIHEYCARTGQRQPKGPGEMVRCILESLALSYRHALEQLERILGRRFRVLHIVGGGSRNSLLCQLTANATGFPVLAGPVEATVTGNVLVQALALGYIASAEEIRDVVRSSSALVEYEPKDTLRWQNYYAKYLRLVEQKAG